MKGTTRVRNCFYARNRKHAMAFATVVCVQFASASFGDTATWNGSTGNWSDPARWSSNPFFPNNGTPGSLYDVTINAGAVALDVNPATQSLTLAGGTINGTGNLDILGSMLWMGGTLAGSGSLTTSNLTINANSFGGGGAYQIASGSRAFVSTGVTTWSSNFAHVDFSSASASYTNQGAFNISTSNNSNWFGGTFNNQGTLTKTSADTNNITSAFNNSGTVSVNAGVLNLYGGGTQTGAFVLNNGNIGLNGSHAFSTTAPVNGSGYLSVLGGSTTFNASLDVGNGNDAFYIYGGTATFNYAFSANGNIGVVGGILNINNVANMTTLNLTGGILQGSGNFSVTGATIQMGGTLAGSGSLTTSNLTINANSFGGGGAYQIASGSRAFVRNYLKTSEIADSP